ncbi:galactosyltransferase-related protein [Microbulbifer sp.]|uniref:galactosyltransferase-related protein n=1 Tax=Microbulbifer sp. TaxID=1908541 RepID=UPI002590416C|nr:galactosyltransferase-related protein [Microbulbifer sp.]
MSFLVKITAIIPVKLNSERMDLPSRLLRLVHQCVAQGVKVAIAQEYGKKTEIIPNEVISLDGVKLVAYESTSAFNLAKARNKALEIVDTEWVIFLDADLLLPNSFLEMINKVLHNKFARSPSFFLSVPVFYLSKNSSALSLTNNSGCADLIYGNGEVEHWALSSSVILTRKSTIRSLGGYNEEYCGWGYEDHDMAARLVSRDATFLVPDYPHIFDPRPMQSLTRYLGWRAKYALYGRLSLEYGLYLVHEYHPKNNDFVDFELVDRNRKIFRENLKKIKFMNFKKVHFSASSMIYAQYYLYFEQKRNGKVLAMVKDWLLRSPGFVKTYQKLRSFLTN